MRSGHISHSSNVFCIYLHIRQHMYIISPINQQVHESIMASPSATINYLEDFLLNNGPKQDCLIHICKYIDLFDMLHLSESSKHSELFMEFFKDRVLHRASFEFTEVMSLSDKTELFQKVMENFGSKMQKIKVSALL